MKTSNKNQSPQCQKWNKPTAETDKAVEDTLRGLGEQTK
jgi:hypothetical protein